jgi:hypothetical protein
MIARCLCVIVGMLVAGAAVAQAAPPLVDPVVVPLGGSVHLTPVDQNGVPIVPSNVCTIIGWPSAGGLPATLVAVSYDATGAIITAVTPVGDSGLAQWKCVHGITVVPSVKFTVTVPPVPWSVTAVGHTIP